MEEEVRRQEGRDDGGKPEHGGENDINRRAAETSALTAWDIGKPKHGGEEAFGHRIANKTIFVAVFTSPKTEDRRNACRRYWKVPPHVVTRYVLCQDSKSQVSAQETHDFKDILFVNCTEGYAHGLLTAKVVATMQIYLREYPTFPFFFKTDDDNYVNFGLLNRYLSRPAKYHHIYSGAIRKGGIGSIPNRRVGAKFEEPNWTFPEDTYPPTALGGTGYILDRDLVQFIMTSGIFNKWLMWNEDRAMAVWVREVNKTGRGVEYRSLPAMDGLWPPEMFCAQMGKHANFPHVNHNVMYHHVTPQQMLCLRAGLRKVPAAACGC